MFDEMCLKTIKREVFSAKHMPRDPKKVDDAYQYMKMREAKYAEMEAESEIDSFANATIIDTTPDEPKQLQRPGVDFETGEVIEPEQTKIKADAAPVQETMAGPNF